MNHPQHAISPKATIGPGTHIGAFAVIEDDVVIGAACRIGHHVVIRSGSFLGDEVRVDDHTTIGKLPMRAANSAVTKERALAGARIGDGCLVGSGAVIYAGSVLEERVLVADLATIREDVTIGMRTIVGRGAAIENQCTIGAFCKLETNAYITAYSTLEDYVFVAPGVLTSNDNFIGRSKERFEHFKGVIARRGARLGVGSITLPGVELGADSVAAAGSLITRNTEDGKIHVGVPAKPRTDVPDDQLLDNQDWFD